MGPPWSPFWPPESPQEHPKGTPKAAQDPPKWPYGAKMVDSTGHFVPQSRPKSFLKHPKAPIVCQNLKFSPPNHQFSFKINDFQQSIVHRRPTDVQRTSPNMGRRQCYAHQYIYAGWASPHLARLTPDNWHLPAACASTLVHCCLCIDCVALL